MYTITKIKAREILDSRGNPTVEVDITINEKFLGRASVPSGASVGSKEALELRDNNSRYAGKGVSQAVANIEHEIAKHILNRSYETVKHLDELLINLDGTPTKSRLGANSILAVSMAFTRALSNAQNKPLYTLLGEKIKMPLPFINVINGGAHANNKLDIQEFMIIPNLGGTFHENIRAGAEIFQMLKKVVGKKYSTSVGDEGGFAPDISSSKQALDMICEAVQKAGYKLGTQVSLALDVAASELYENGKYNLKGENLVLDSAGMARYFEELIKEYPIVSIEDPMSEHDHEGWKVFTELLSHKIQIVGDDVFVTNPKLIEHGIKEGIANSVLIKLNQIGTVTECLHAIKIANDSGYKAVISHRSGETADTFISHLAVGTGVGQIKTGSCCRGERIEKYNELLRIEEAAV